MEAPKGLQFPSKKLSRNIGLLGPPEPAILTKDSRGVPHKVLGTTASMLDENDIVTSRETTVHIGLLNRGKPIQICLEFDSLVQVQGFCELWKKATKRLQKKTSENSGSGSMLKLDSSTG
ncbi:hypothetical protein HDU76_011141 [Blyttiomyces sp. JEL0837]|nr:hypothetical protein HDU76_011141 [Blyttiomyces sp. JEL0837]